MPQQHENVQSGPREAIFAERAAQQLVKDVVCVEEIDCDFGGQKVKARVVRASLLHPFVIIRFSPVL